MRKNVALLLFVTIFVSCVSEEEITPTPTQEPDATIEVKGFEIKINSPIQTRDYSFYNGGVSGIFENPENEKFFQGSIQITYEENSAHLNPNDIEVVWRSDIDGILYQGSPNNYLESEISKKLSSGLHTIYFEASIPSKGIVVKDNIMLSNNLKLSAKNTGKSVKLDWTKYTGDDFVSYMVYSEDFSPIAEISDINTLSYDNKVFPSLIAPQKYQVIVNTTNNYNHIIGSNIESMHPGQYVTFPYYLRKITKDPFRPRLYALVGNKNYTSDAYGLAVIDFSEEKFEIKTHILKDDFFTDLDITEDGNFMFLSETKNEKITKLNLNSLESETFPTQTNSWGIEKIEVTINNILLCYGNSPAMNASQFLLYDGNSGALIGGPIVSPIVYADFEFDSLNNALFAGKSSMNNGQLFKFSVTETSVNINSFPLWLNTISNPSPFLFLTDDKQHLFWENHQLDLNMNIVRTFSSNIKACSPTNMFLADLNKVYDYRDLFTVYEFPAFPEGNSITNSLTFPDDMNLVYCRASQSNIKNNDEANYAAQTYIFKFRVGKTNVL